ncbi:hypothetical protein ACHAW6_004842 [Cyclotella cf. meneghiniana]
MSTLSVVFRPAKTSGRSGVNLAATQRAMCQCWRCQTDESSLNLKPFFVLWDGWVDMPTEEGLLYLTDKLIADAEDLRVESYKSFVAWGASQETADAFIEKVLPLHLGNLERQLKNSSGGYFVGDFLTIADIACYDAIVNFGSSRVPGALDQFPALIAWVAKVESNEGIKQYLASDSFASLMKFGPETLGIS